MKKALLLTLCAAVLAAAASPSRSADISVIRVPHGGIQPQAAVDHSGTLHLLYYVGDRLHGDLFYVKSSDAGSTWSAPLRVNSEAGSALAQGSIRGGQMAVGENGRIHVAWNGSLKTGPKGMPMLYSRLNDAHSAFEPERDLMTQTSDLDGGGTIAADARGAVYVAWHGRAAGAAAGEAGREVWIAKSNDEGKTFSAEKSAWNGKTGACGCCDTAMFVDSKGTLRMLYRSATENVHRDIYMLTSPDQAKSFEGRKLHTWDINACPMTSMAFSEADGKVEAAWETGGQVFFEDVSSANASPVSAPGESKGHKHPRLAMSRDGGTLMAWTEGTGMSHGGSLAWQRYDASGKAVGEKCSAAGLPALSFGAVVAKRDGFVILY